MPKLSRLFDMQKIVESEALASVIEETHSRYKNVEMLDDDMMELAVAGMGTEKDELIRVSCPTCGYIFKASVSQKQNICPDCGRKIMGKK